MYMRKFSGNCFRKKFEWIRDSERLITEDKCAIYSLTYDGERYTIEFVSPKKDTYEVSKIRGAYNCDCPIEAREYVEKFIEGRGHDEC